jgi:hypothetical protein
MIGKAELFRIWAPPDGPWSDWVKPILFANWPRELPAVELPPPPDCTWVPPASEQRALIVEMPGTAAVSLGLSLAEAGYRPVPVFGGSLPPIRPRHPSEPTPDSPAVVDVDSILAAILIGADRLATTQLALSAPPAFLIDKLRSNKNRPLSAGCYDNRSWIYTTEFPSGQRLGSAGVNGVLLITASTGALAEDLEHLLRVWSAQGCKIEIKRLSDPGPPKPFMPTRPSWLTGFKLWLSSLFVDPVLGRGHFISGSG